MMANLVSILLVFAITVFFYFKWRFNYWKKRNLPSLEPRIPFGNLENPFTGKLSSGILLMNYYKEFRSQGYKHGGFYNFVSPVYMAISPDYIKNIMQKDFNHFVDRGRYYNEKNYPLSGHLFNIGGEKWRNLRVKLTPTFTSGKIKTMFEILVRSSNQMNDAMSELCEKGDPIDIKEVVARFTTDVIGSCAFGVDCNSFQNPNAEFRVYGKKIFSAPSKMVVLKEFIASAKPEIADFLRISLWAVDSFKFFFEVVKETVNFREMNNITKQDALQLLIDLKNNESEIKGTGKSLTIEELAAQAFVFFVAGFETSATTMAFCLFELSQNLEMQNRLRNDINRILKKHDGKVTYDSITDMRYLGQVIAETLRMYPPVPFITRKCIKDYRVPNNDLTIEKGTLVYIPVLGLHYDEEYFPDPQEFDPERFSETNKKNIPPFTYLPFGEGPRACIGLRFGLMQVKVALITLLRNYNFSLSKKTELPLQINCHAVILTNAKRIWVDVTKINM